jgi:DNA-binding response OmpR family regulator
MSTNCILLVEDDVLVRHPLAEYLRECGFFVLEAQDVAEAKSLLDAKTRPVDIVFVEGEAGFTLAAYVRAEHPGVEFLFAGSVAKATETAGELCEDGPALIKPYEHRFVLARIRRLLAARERTKN